MENCADVFVNYMPVEYRSLDQQEYSAVRAALRDILESSKQYLVSG